MGKIFIQPGTSISTIQRALDCRGSTLVFTPGIHRITHILYIGSEVMMIGLPGSKLQQAAPINNLLMTRCYKNTTKYNGARKIVIDGLTIEGMSKYKAKLNLLTLWHAQDITVHNCTFIDTQFFHALEANGCKNVLVDNCKFLGYHSDPAADFRESIQIDFSSESAIYVFMHKSKCYDNTCCENITVRKCTFDKSQSWPGASRCIGNHCQPRGSSHKNIIIEDNVLKGYGTNKNGSAIELLAMDNVVVRNNTAEGFGRFCHSQAKKYSYDKNGNKKNPCASDGFCKQITYENNTVTNPTSKFIAWRYYAEPERK